MADRGEYQPIAPKPDSVPNASGDDSKSRRNKRRKSLPVPAACQRQCRLVRAFKAQIVDVAPDCRRRKAKVRPRATPLGSAR
jgi:hypothetical protein